MSKLFLTSINLNQNELQNARVQNLAAAPGSPGEGQIYYDSDGGDKTIYYWNGTEWVPFDARKRTSIPLANLATDPLARANHTGTQASTTISDWGEAVADTVGAMLTGNTATNITVTYQDADNTIDFVVAGASETVKGVVELATTAEVQTGTDTARAVTPAGFRAGGDARYSQTGHTHTGVYEPVIAAGTTAQYWRGDKSWQTLDKSAVGLGNVENTALSTWAGSANITTVGTIATGTWNGTVIADGKIASALTGKTYNSLTLTAAATGFTIAGGTTSKTLTVSNTLTLAGTDASTLNIGTGGTLGTAAFTASTAYATAGHNHSGVYEPADAAIQAHIDDTTYHLDSTQKTDLTDGGSSTLHYHTADRDRANHTGTQTAATISNFDTQVRTSRLDQMAAPTASVSMNSQKITNLLSPTADTDAATKGYVDSAVAGLSWKEAAVALSTANITLTAPGATIGGVTMATGDRFLAKDQTTPSQNGVYVWNGAASTATRATDCDSQDELLGMAIMIQEGTGAGTQWVLTTDDTITVGTTSLAFAQFGGGTVYTAGNGLTLSTNDFNVGAGTGISVAADSVSIDTAVVVRKYAVSVGDGTNVNYTVTHNLNTLDVTVAVYANSGGAEVECDVTHATVNTITLGFATAPTSNQYRCVVHG